MWELDPDIAFLNHGSFGACPRPVLEHQTALRMQMERQPVSFLVYELEERLDVARAALASFIGAPADGIAFVPNATAGVNAIVGSLDLQPGDEIVVTDHGYNACKNIVDHAAARSGAVVRTVPLPFAGVTPDVVYEAVLAGTGARTRLVIVDHVTSATGLVLPVERIAAELEKRSVPVLIDGAHGPGMLPLDITAIRASYYVGNCHKWMCAPKGSGFVFAAAATRDHLMPSLVSHGFNSVRTDRSRYHLMFDWTGTDDPTPYLAVPRAIEVMGGLFPGGWNELRQHNHDLAIAGRDILAAALGFNDLPGEDMIGSMAAIALSAGPPVGVNDFDPLSIALREKYRIEVPISPFQASGIRHQASDGRTRADTVPVRMLRISAQVYNRIEEYERLASALVSEGITAAP